MHALSNLSSGTNDCAASGGGPILSVIAGGEDGDLPLSPENAETLIRAAMQNRVSIVFDLYDVRISKADWRRVTEAIIRTMLYENKAYGLRHIFIEEAAEFAPQRPNPGQNTVLAEVEKLARMGGNALLGYTLINQRSEEVSKAVLELCDTLILHRQKGRNSLTNLEKWLSVSGTKANAKAIIDTMPTLKQGEAWAWISGAEHPVHIQFPMKRSFAPDRRSTTGSAATASMAGIGSKNVAGFVSAMKAAIEEEAAAKEKAAAATRAAKTPAGPPVTVDAGGMNYAQAAHDKGYRDGYAAGFADCAKKAGDVLRGHLDVQMRQHEEMRIRLLGAMGMFHEPAPEIPTPIDGNRLRTMTPLSSEGSGSTYGATPLQRPNGGGRVQGGDLEAGKTYNVALPSGVVSDADPVLQTVARHHPVALTWSQIMTMLGRKARGGHFNTQRKRLLEQGYVTEHNDAVIAADRLWTIVEKPERPADLTEVFRKTLPDPARRIFEYLVQWHGPRCSEEQIGSALSLKPKGGHWNSAMSTLTRANLIFKTNGFIALNHHFLKGGN